MKSKDLKIDDISDLRTFMLEFKSWAQDHHENQILSRLKLAERRGYSASELIHEYGLALKDISTKHLNHLPENFRMSVERGIKVAEDAINLGSYTY
jgi:hypothetical protein